MQASNQMTIKELKTKLKKTTKEAVVQKMIMDYLDCLSCVACYWRNNTGATTFNYKRKDGSSAQYFVRFGVKGLSDICGYMNDGKALFIETKRPHNAKKSIEQVEFIKKAVNAGAVAFFASSIDDVTINLQDSGYKI